MEFKQKQDAVVWEFMLNVSEQIIEQQMMNGN